MKIKNDLVERVRKGEACIEHTGFKKDLFKLQELINYCFTGDGLQPTGISRYYYAIDHNLWHCGNFPPSGMVAIPLDDFFEQEEKVETVNDNKVIEAYGLKTRTWTLRDGKYGCSECCNRDRCDEDCDAVYYRRECPHCKGKGWIPESDVVLNIELECWALRCLFDIQNLIDRYRLELPNETGKCTNHIYNEIQSALIKNKST